MSESPKDTTVFEPVFHLGSLVSQTQQQLRNTARTPAALHDSMCDVAHRREVNRCFKSLPKRPNVSRLQDDGNQIKFLCFPQKTGQIASRMGWIATLVGLCWQYIQHVVTLFCTLTE